MTIRPFQKHDTLGTLKVFKQAVHEINKRDYLPEQLAVWAPEKQDINEWEEKLSRNITFVAEKDGEIIGFADITPQGHLEHLYISPHHQGGLASLKLFKAIIEAAKSKNLKEITTNCSITAQKPAERMGFITVKEQTVIKNGMSFTNYAMKKKLY